MGENVEEKKSIKVILLGNTVRKIYFKLSKERGREEYFMIQSTKSSNSG